MSIRKNLHWLIYPLFALACARQTAPTGGPKDTIPPNLVKTIPANEQTNYKHQNIELTFDEMLVLNNPKDQIIITPDVGKDFEAEVKKNKVIVNFKTELQNNTTYSVNFREAVQDITEKNPAERLKLAFSTGSYIDSLSIQGNVFDLLKSKEVKEATVALYQSDTFNIFTHKPSYFTKTDTKGNFEIANLKPGDYFIYAVEDKNKNLITDSKSEPYGFLSQKITLTEDIKGVNIPIIHLDTRPLVLTSARPTGTYYNIKTSKSLSQYKITTNQNENIISSYGEDQANIQVFNTISNLDSIPIHLRAEDSIGNKIDTTLYMKFSKREAKPDAFKVTNDGFRVIGTKGKLIGQLTLTKPLLSINYDSIYYQIDSSNIIKITPENIRYDSAKKHIFIEKNFDKTLLVKNQPPSIKSEKPAEKTKKILTKEELKQTTQPIKHPEQQLYVAAKSFISIELDTSKNIKEQLKPTTLESTGIVVVQTDTKAEHFIVELLTKDYKIKASKANALKTTFEDLDPAEYLIRLIIDTNNDGKWSPGNFFTSQQPEPIVFYKNEKQQTTINLKANWELGPLLIKY